MRRIIRPSIAVLGAILALSLLAKPSQAAPRTWVASFGGGTTCSRVSPCANFQAAHNATDVGGEINCVDAGDFSGDVTINKSISIVCDYTVGGLIPVNVGITIDAPAGSAITLKGLDIQCGNANAIVIQNAAVTVHVQKVHIRNCAGSAIVVLNSSGVVTLSVADSYITDSGQSNTQAGIRLLPGSGASANLSVINVKLENNTTGIFADGSGGAGPMNVDVVGSVVTHNSNSGIVAASSGAAITVFIDNTTVNYNLNTGVAVAGAGAIARISNSNIVNNITGVAAFSGGSLRSYKNNRINANSTDGTPIAAADALN